MATLMAWGFPTALGAERAETILEQLQKQELIKVHDAAVVSWPEGAKRPKTRRLKNLAAHGVMGGAVWGFLFGLIFFLPWLGMAIGAAAGAWAGSKTVVGINDNFIKQVRSEITPGTSALFVMTSAAVMDKVDDAFEGMDAKLLSTNLSKEQEQALRNAFGED